MDLRLNLSLGLLPLALLFANPVACGEHDDGVGGSAGTGRAAGASGTGSGGNGGSGAGTGGAGGSGAVSTGGSTSSGGTGGGHGGSGTGGAVGSGGTAGNWGTGGTGGSKGPDGKDCGCTPAPLSWGMDGGLSFYREWSELHPCRSFVFIRQETSGPNLRLCKDDMDNCLGGTITIEDVRRALSHDDVRRAFSARKVLFGEDTRPADGQVLRIELEGAIIEIGQPCRSATCPPIPLGVDALGTMLRLLTTQELARPRCRDAFPPP